MQINTPKSYKNSTRRMYCWLFGGAVGLMLLCQIFFSLMQFSALESKLRSGMLDIAESTAGTLADDLSMGLRLGKSVHQFYNLHNLLFDAYKAFPLAHDICVIDTQGNLIMSMPNKTGQDFTQDGSSAQAAGDFTANAQNLYSASQPLLDRNNITQGYVLVRLHESVLQDRIQPVFTTAVRNILLAMAVTLAATLLIMRFVPFFTAQGELLRKRIYLSFGTLFALVLLFSATLNHVAFREEYRSIAVDNARTMGLNVRETLSRIISKGVPISLLQAVEEYFETAAAKTSGAVLIELYRPGGVLAFSSHKVFAGEDIVPGSVYSISFSDAESPDGIEPWMLKTSLSQDAFSTAMRDDILNSASICVISLTMLFELLLLLCLLLDRSVRAGPALMPETAPDQRYYGTLLRTIFFLFIMGMDMSITFIPLRMAALPTDFLGLPPDVVMGLPISAEVTMAGICIFLTGRLVARHGAALPMAAGFLLAGLGYLASALASTPLAFILARGVAGSGYGIAIMAAQAYVYRSGGLANLFAGVFAGSLCGGAAGSMLAEKLGFSAAFYTSSILMFALAALPYMLLQRGDFTRAEKPTEQNTKAGLWRAFKALGNRQFLALSLFSILPATFLLVGFNKYFMPVYLSRAAVSQADIGRVYMVYCLVLIYLGPVLGKLMRQARNKAAGVTLGCLLGALSLMPLALFDSLWPTVLCAFTLGLANAVNIPAQSEYLLRLQITAQLGSSQALGLLNVMERIGQALAPIIVGLLMSVYLVPEIALWGGLGFLVLAGGFYLTRVKE